GLSPNGDCPIDGCWDRPPRGQSLRDESIRSSTASAPALSSGSFRSPHFGLWMQDGQPSRHGQPRSILAVSSTQPERQGLSPNGDCPINGCWDRPLRGQSLRDESIRSSTASAPALSSGSFRLPHFGLWTQDGQPSRHGQPASIRAVSSTQPSKASKPRSVIPTPPAWPSYTKIVGAPVWKWTFVERPPMSQRSHIAQSGSSAIRECSAAWSEPSSRRSESRSSVIQGSGTNQIASVSNSVCGRSSCTRSSEAWSWIDFFWYATTCSLTTTLPKESSSPRRRSARWAWSIAVIVSFFACV